MSRAIEEAVRMEEWRKLFEYEAENMGFGLTRHSCPAPEPWSEYADAATGHRWAGWLAGRHAARAEALMEAAVMCESTIIKISDVDRWEFPDEAARVHTANTAKQVCVNGLRAMADREGK